LDIKNRPRIPIPDEDPYSIASSGSSGFGASGSSGEIGREKRQSPHKRNDKPPKLPPRDSIYQHDIPNGFRVSFASHEISDSKSIKSFHLYLPRQPDYDEIEDDSQLRQIASARGKSDKGKNNNKYGELSFIPATNE